MNTVFQHNLYLLKRQVFALTGKLRLYDPNGQLALYCEQKMFKLKEDIRVFADETKQQELLHIKARQIIDFAAAYDVVDSQTQTKVGVLRRKGFRSMLRDSWEVLGPQDQHLGILQEDSAALAMLRRLILGSLLPQNYDLLVNDQRAVDIRQRFNLFRYELNIEFDPATAKLLDHRLGIAAAILLAIIEGRQQ